MFTTQRTMLPSLAELFLCAFCMFHYCHCGSKVKPNERFTKLFLEFSWRYLRNRLINVIFKYMLQPKLLITIVCLLILQANAFTQNRYSVVISEIMSDPTPQIGLPNFEWIEIRNTTTSAINLQNWRVGDASGVSGALPNFLLQPDSSAIICGTTAAATMQQYGRTFGVTSFPSLDNNGETIFIRSNTGSVIHAVEYNLSWFNNAVKSDGGWTLEMVDVKIHVVAPATGVQVLIQEVAHPE
jgi:hypothetical protein